MSEPIHITSSRLVPSITTNGTSGTPSSMAGRVVPL